MIGHYHKETEYSPEAAQRELYELIVKAGRRCAHDLAHCADLIPTELNTDLGSKFFHERAKMWLDVFYMEDGKNYRHKLHHIINDYENLVDKYRELVKAHNINADFDDELPF